MAGVFFTLRSTRIHSGAALKTFLQIIAATNTRVLVHKIEVLAYGTNPVAEAPLVQVAKQTTAGTAGTSPATPTFAKEPDVTETLQTTAQAGSPAAANAWGAEPTLTDVYAAKAVPPTAGDVFHFPTPHEIPGGQRRGVTVTAAADQELEVIAYCEE